jgi:sirohydrochlorin cobaltochelatase
LRAVILVDHGSRERAANAQLAAIAGALARRLRGRRVMTAHLSIATPGLPAAIDACVAEGAREIVVMPYFLALGRHAKHDVPRLARAARARHPGVRITVSAPSVYTPGSWRQWPSGSEAGVRRGPHRASRARSS